MNLFLREVRNQQRLFWRNRESAVFVFIFPPMLFLLLGAVYSGKIEGFRAADVLLVGLIGYGCANTAFAGLAITLVIRRENGALKRIRATPLPPPTYLTAFLASTLFVFILQMLLTIALGVTLYGATGPENRLGMIPVVLLGGACFAGLGFGATVAHPHCPVANRPTAHRDRVATAVHHHWPDPDPTACRCQCDRSGHSQSRSAGGR